MTFTSGSKRGLVLQGFFCVERFRGTAQAKQSSFWPGKAPQPDLMVAGTLRAAGGGAVQARARNFWAGKAPRPDLMPSAAGGAAVQRKQASASPSPWAAAPRPALLPGMTRHGLMGVAQARSEAGRPVTSLVPDGRLRAMGPGKPLDAEIRERMEGFFGADLSGVRVHEGPAASAMGALAFTLGETVCFAPGLYDLTTRDGLELLGHELVHVVQQRSGRVRNPHGRGIALVQDPELEAEAMAMGRRAAAAIWPGRKGHGHRATPKVPTRTLATVQQSSKKLEVKSEGLMIYSLGFEFQSSDLFVVWICNKGEGAYECRYATNDDIPENTPVWLDKLSGGARIGVQLDAVDPPTDILYYINQIEKFSFKCEGKSFSMIPSEAPQDTEFVSLDTNRDSVLYFEPKKGVVEDPVELIKSHYEFLKLAIFHYRFRDSYHTLEYETKIGNYTKFNVLRIPLQLPEKGDTVGFIQHGFKLEDARRVSFVPQVTFSCGLADAFSVLRMLSSKTYQNKHSLGLKKSIETILDLELETSSSGAGFLFLLHYYTEIMQTGSKQNLGIALRHKFQEVFDSLPLGEKINISKYEGLDARMKLAKKLESSDGIHRYDYDSEKLIVLIEYRLFSYVISDEGYDKFDQLPIK